MTAERREQITLRSNNLISILISIALAMTAWFLNQAWSRINDVETKVYAIEKEIASTTGNRFTSNDWMREKSIFDQKDLEKEKRLMKVEEAIFTLKEKGDENNVILKELQKFIQKSHPGE